jgi:mRNA interferase RelE/StbE
VSSNYRLTYRKEALKFLEKQSPDTQNRIKNGLKGLVNNPPLGDIKKLTNRELYRLRIGSFRVLFKIDHENEMIHIHIIGNRGDVY